MNYELIPHDAGGSLPSDHATAAFTIAVAIGWFLYRRWGITLLVTATVVGVARIWVGVHYPGDILAGLGIALASVLVIEAATRLVHPLNGSSASCTP
ncbi:phosphatase PAP2 family protein [Dactylosporangium sp. NPDC006015]|uniref:phosphatase PAP2 family protein n=1 Tax=Dactylosporangium sp. NPDC006015 TaxID=3154576 RepID=UPI0033A533B0